MAAVFDQGGVRFEYPENWLLEQQTLDEGYAVSVSSPGGSFWSLSVHSPDLELAEVARAVVEGLCQEYEDLDMEAVSETVAARQMLGYDISFYCLDLTNTAQVRGFQTPAATYVMLWQGEDREYEEVAPVFRAITASLVQNADSG